MKPTNNMPPIKLGQGEYEREDWCDDNSVVIVGVTLFVVVMIAIAIW